MTTPLSPSEKLDLLKGNLKPDYKQYLILRPVNTLAELLTVGESLDASRTPIYSKVFGGSKEVAAVSENPAYSGSKPTQLQQGNARFTRSKVFL